MASFETLQQLTAHPEWIAPRSDLRVFLGEPGAPEATKTTIEPGNVFSPGMRTFGVTWWLYFPDDPHFFATETAPLESLGWRYEAGYLPIIHCTTRVLNTEVQHTVFQDGTASQQTEAVCSCLQLTNPDSAPQRIQIFIALRSLGPAGGPLRDLNVGPDRRSFWLTPRTLPLLGFDAAPASIGCGIGDPSPLARAGQSVDAPAASDPEGWCFGLARFDVTLAAGDTWTLHYDCPLQTYGNLQNDFPGRAGLHPADFATRMAAHRAQWQRRFGEIGLEVPDEDFRNAFFAGLGHMLTASVGSQARIAPLAYPLPWLRDSVYIIRCFDLAGAHDRARGATEYCARNDFFGGFGAEGDAPGQGIWAIVQHYRITRDPAWLQAVYPAIRRKCEWLFRMRRTSEPIQVVTDTPVLSFTQAERGAGVICVAARDGIIMGTMDHGVTYALGWVNHWALCGLREAAYAARELDLISDAVAYENEAQALAEALAAFSERTPAFFEWERTVNSLLWPTRAWEEHPEQIEAGFNQWYQQNRGGDGAAYQPEPYWLYFEMAQAHNALLLGQRERAWQVIQYRLQHQDLPGLYGWREGGDGVGTENAVHGVTLIHQLRGCHLFESITPHGWSQAEMWLLQRAALVEEWQGELLLFAGIPAAWLQPQAHIQVDRLPTYYGRVSVSLDVDAQGHRVRLACSGVNPGTALRVRLPGVPDVSVTVNEQPVVFTIALSS